MGRKKKEWLTTIDGRERPDHAAANGQVVLSQDAFTVGGERLRFPGDPQGSPGNTINCRCTVLPVVGEMAGVEEQPGGIQTIEEYGASWRNTLSSEEDKAIKQYVGTKYRVDNAVLRRGLDVENGPPYGWNDDGEDVARIDAITSALDKTSTPNDFVVYRGFEGSKTGDMMAQLQPGQTFTDWGFVSTSTNQEYAFKEFRGHGEVNAAQITVPKGSKAAYLTQPHETAPEWELLIQRGAEFEVEGFDTIGDTRIIKLRLKNTNPGRFWQSYDDWEDAAYD